MFILWNHLEENKLTALSLVAVLKLQQLNQETLLCMSLAAYRYEIKHVLHQPTGSDGNYLQERICSLKLYLKILIWK